MITGKAAFEHEQRHDRADRSRVAARRRCAAFPDVADAEGGVNGEAQLIGTNGKAIVFGGAPNLGFSDRRRRVAVQPADARRRQRGRTADEVVIDKATANKKHFAVGDDDRRPGEGPGRAAAASPGSSSSARSRRIGGATLAGFDLPTAQTLFDKPDQLDEIAIAAKPGVSRRTLLSEVRAILPPNAQVRTAQQQAAEDAKDTNSFISFLRGFLLAFGGIALFVGSFVIANSLSITIAQRTREFATLRTLGASRRQVLRSIVIEALVSARSRRSSGCSSASALAKGLFKLFDAVGFTLPNSGLVVRDADGGRRAARRHRRDAAREPAPGVPRDARAADRGGARGRDAAASRASPASARSGRRSLTRARLRRARSTACSAAASARRGCSIWMGVGALLIFFGVALLSVRFVRPLAGACSAGRRRRLGGAAGCARARQRAAQPAAHRVDRGRADDRARARHARRRARRRDHVDVPRRGEQDLDGADYAITAQNNFSPIPIAAANAARNGARASRRSATSAPATRGRSARPSSRPAVNPPGATMFNLDWMDGSQAASRDARRRRRVRRQGLREEAPPQASARRSPMTFSSGAHKTFVVRGIFDPPTGGSPFGTRDDLAGDVGQAQREPAEPLLVRAHERRRDATRTAPTLDAALEAVPEREGADAAEVHRQPDQRPELDPEHPLRAARAVGDREPVRDRQHARPDRVRADARARDAARDRDDAAPGAADDPARERDHRADRRRARDRARDRARRAARRARRLHRVLAAGRLARSCSRSRRSSSGSSRRSSRPGGPRG